MLVVSEWARRNFVDHSVTDQTSILRFIEDNWDLGRIGDFSYDAQAGTFENMFDFSRARAGKLFLDPATDQVLSADE
jgi:phospholipase C